MPDRELDAWIAEHVMGWESDKCMICPPYSSDPAADYLVLEKVRNDWGETGRTDFVRCLHSVWQDQQPKITAYFRAFLYTPGDYSRAARAALNGAES